MFLCPYEHVPRFIASKHYYQHASLSGICSIEILGDHFNQDKEVATTFCIIPRYYMAFLLPTRICYVKACLEIEAESFIYNVCCHLKVPPNTDLTAATHFLLSGKGYGFVEDYIYVTVSLVIFLPEFL